MGSQKLTTRSAGIERSALQAAGLFVAAASRLFLRGFAVAVLMGVIFGILIGVGGLLLGVETARLVNMGLISGWVSGFIAMVFVLYGARFDKPV